MDEPRQTTPIAPPSDPSPVPVKWARGENGITITCPSCQAQGKIDADEVRANGDFERPVSCPKCDFYRFVTLKGWPGSGGS